MNGWYIASLVLSIMTVVNCIAIFLVPNRKVALLLRFSFDIISICNSICLFIYLGDKVILALLAGNIVSSIRDVVFYFRGTRRWADSYAWIFIFSIILVTFSVLAWSSWLTLFPIFGTLINTGALYLKDYKKMKIVTLVGQIFFILYYVFLIPEGDILIIINLLASSAMFISALVGLIIYFIKGKHIEKSHQE